MKFTGKINNNKINLLSIPNKKMFHSFSNKMLPKRKYATRSNKLISENL